MIEYVHKNEFALIWQEIKLSTLDYLINVMYGISEMALNKDSYHLVFLLIGMYLLIGEKVGKILQK